MTGPRRFPSVARSLAAGNTEFLGKTGRNSPQSQCTGPITALAQLRGEAGELYAVIHAELLADALDRPAQSPPLQHFELEGGERLDADPGTSEGAVVRVRR